MSPAFYLWYGMKIGLQYDRALNIPFGELSDLIAADQIQNGLAKQKHRRTEAEERTEFFRLLSFR